MNLICVVKFESRNWSKCGNLLENNVLSSHILSYELRGLDDDWVWVRMVIMTCVNGCFEQLTEIIRIGCLRVNLYWFLSVEWPNLDWMNFEV